MSQDKKKAEKSLQHFVQEVVEHQKVWGLYCQEGWANVDSHEFDDTIVYTFWSSAELAKACAIQEWHIYQPQSLELAEFLENWCVGMYKEYIMAGPNWDVNLFGKEVEPLDLAYKILDELNRRGKQLHYRLYNNQDEFEDMIRNVE